ncbi:hypothetical protein AAFC00_001617 [Neodothiora populina]|uniref:Allantoate permease n=1 Tax=Neodothiora populina TaxID=2781224 RepID=A0ABR3PPK7_9PEZI
MDSTGKSILTPDMKADTDVSEGQISEYTHDQALVWKLDRRLLPLLCITYMLQSIDKTTLGYAAVFDIREDTHLRGMEYSWLGSIFYLGYLAFEYPFSVLLQKLPVNKVMAGTVCLGYHSHVPCSCEELR